MDRRVSIYIKVIVTESYLFYCLNNIFYPFKLSTDFKIRIDYFVLEYTNYIVILNKVKF